MFAVYSGKDGSGFGNVLDVFVGYLLNSPNSGQLFNQFNPA
jgi:hypothetical protein|tara:strand:+ start:1218 stop:1340 length:123 start_codon:yes stop_codon:yes gene_type:complete